MLSITPFPSTSAALAAQISDETGSSLLVFNTSPTLVTPVLGTPSSGTLSSCTAATDGTAGVMSAADHTTLTALSGQTSGTAPPFVAVGLLCMAYKTGVDFKTNAITDIFTVAASRTFVCTNAYMVPTAITSGAAVAIVWKIVESGGGTQMSGATANSSNAPVLTRNWTESNLVPGASPLSNCAAGNKVQFSITTAWTTSTAVTGTVFVLGFYAT